MRSRHHVVPPDARGDRRLDLWSHRIGLAVAARDAGYDVTIVTRVGEHGERIRALGLDLVNVDFARGLLSPRANLRTVSELCAVYRRCEPHLVHHVAIKPIVLGSAAAARTRVSMAVNALAGLGTALSSRNMKARLTKPFLRAALGWAMRRSRSHTMVQNPENAQFVESLGVHPERISLVRGAGVDVQRFRPRPEPEGPVRVTMVSRLLWDKGMREFVDAAMLVRKVRGDVVFTLVGTPDEENPASVSSEQVQSWAADGLVEWWGYREDVADVLACSHVAVLPSYGEGLPKTLLEAAACGRPIVATDVSGRWCAMKATVCWCPPGTPAPNRDPEPATSEEHPALRHEVPQDASPTPPPLRASRPLPRRRRHTTVHPCTTRPTSACSPIAGWSKICSAGSSPESGLTRSTSPRWRSCPRSS